MIERVTIEAREIRRGDVLHDVEKDGPGAVALTVRHDETGRRVDAWTDRADDYGLGMPCLSVPDDWEVTVWREVDA